MIEEQHLIEDLKLANNERFPIKQDSNVFAYLLPSNRGRGSIPWEDAVPVVKRWLVRYGSGSESFETAMIKLAERGGLDHQTMDAFSQKQFDHVSVRQLEAIDWKKDFIADPIPYEFHDNLFAPSSPSELILFTTVRITTFGKMADKSELKGFATGFLFQCDNFTGEQRRFVVTNKHVFWGAQKAALSLHVAITKEQKPIPAGHTFEFVLEDLSQIVEHHDDDIDLCALPFDTIEQKAWDDGKDLYTQFLSPELIPTEASLNLMPVIQEVYMYGYPIGLWDSFNQLPIIRKGSLASHPALNYCGKPKGAIDIAAFPGSSGSPIFVLSDGGPISDKNGNVSPNRRVLALLGIMTEGARMNPDGTLDTAAIPVQHQALDKGMLPIHLGFYIKAKELVDFLRLC